MLPGPGPRHRLREATGSALAFAERQPAWLVLWVGLGLVMLVGWLDYLAGAQLSFMPFYLVPVSVVTWLLGRKAGVTVALAGTAAWSLSYFYDASALEWGSIEPYWNVASRLVIFLVVSLILSGLRDALNHEKELARTDPITGAPNSRAFFEQVELELSRSLRYNHSFTVAYLDVDNFKQINDRYGHTVGDTLLRAVAETVRASIRTTDMVARIAGDEFTLLMPETGRKESEMVMARVRKALAATMRGNDWQITFSMGVVTYRIPPPTIDALIKVADDVMYSVKRNGKNSVCHEVYGEQQGAA